MVGESRGLGGTSDLRLVMAVVDSRRPFDVEEAFATICFGKSAILAECVVILFLRSFFFFFDVSNSV